MLARRHSFLVRLMKAYMLLLGSLLFLVWVTGVGFFFVRERSEFVRLVQTAATMIGTQSSAALMFGDAQVLQENLASLRFLRGYRWSAVIPTNVEAPLVAIGHGTVPPNPKELLTQMGGNPYQSSLTELTVRAQISHRGTERGQLLVNVDLGGELKEFGKLLAGTLIGLLVAFGVGLVLFRQIVRSVVAPLVDLMGITSAVSERIKDGVSLVDLPRPARDVDDEVGQLSISFNVMLDSLNRYDIKMREQAERLAQLVEDLRALSARMRAVREEERTRISHEIHDELGQRLTALKYEVVRLEVGDAGKRVAQQIDELIRTVRVISWELRPSVLDSLGLVAAIEWQAQDFARRMGVRCSVDLPEDEPRLSAEMATDLFRVFQELLTNVSRHAQASRVDVLLEVTDASIFLEVKDDGRGIRPVDESRPSLGLLGMRERLERWGGRIDIGPAVQNPIPAGTRVVIEIPLGLRGSIPVLEQMQ